jgi:hypothetical protein
MAATSLHNPPSPPPETPPLPELERFRDNLIKAMAAKRMSGSDVTRAVWGSKTDARGRVVARNRDRMTHYLAGTSYPRPETLARLAEVLDLDPKDLERDALGVLPNGVTSLPVYRAAHAAPGPRHDTPAFQFRLNKRGRVLFSYSVEVDTETAVRLMDAIRAVDPTLEGDIPGNGNGDGDDDDMPED